MLRSTRGTAYGSSFCAVASLVFVFMKLLGIIDWPWLWVLAPVLIPGAVILIFAVIVVLVESVSRLRRWNNRRKQ